jgi:hypothetical protein
MITSDSPNTQNPASARFAIFDKMGFLGLSESSICEKKEFSFGVLAGIIALVERAVAEFQYHRLA